MARFRIDVAVFKQSSGTKVFEYAGYTGESKERIAISAMGRIVEAEAGSPLPRVIKSGRLIPVTVLHPDGSTWISWDGNSPNWGPCRIRGSVQNVP